MAISFISLTLGAFSEPNVTEEIAEAKNDGKRSNLLGNAKYFEGDIELDDSQKNAILYPHLRSGIMYPQWRWPDKKVYYEFSPVFGKEHIAQIRKAWNEIERGTCLKFVPRKEGFGYINITGEPTSCHSVLGYKAEVQNLNLQISEVGKDCFTNGAIIHEFMHALGFYHQQSVYDRDRYVKIVTENIQDGMEEHFIVYGKLVLYDFGVGYDFNSIMHCSPYAYSKNGKMTVVPRVKDVKIGPGDGLSSMDIKKINRMYKCTGKSM